MPAARHVQPRARVRAGVPHQREHQLRGDVAPLEPVGRGGVDELRVAVAVDEIHGNRQRHVLGDLAARSQETEGPGRQQHAVDDVAEANVAEVRCQLLVAAVDQHPHAPVGGHLAELEDAEG